MESEEKLIKGTAGCRSIENMGGEMKVEFNLDKYEMLHFGGSNARQK